MTRCLTSLLAALVLFGLSAVSAAADDEPTSDAPATSTPESPAKADDTSDPAELYSPPEATDAEAITAWVEKVSQTPAPDRTPAGLRDHFRKLEEAADQLIARDIEEDGLIQAVRLKVGANSILEQLGDTSASERKQELIAKLKQDERPAIAVHGKLLDIEQATSELQPNDDPAAQQLIDQVVSLLQQKPITDAHVAVAYSVAEAIETNSDDQLATAAYNMFAKYLKSSSDANHVNVATMFEGAARRINLVGNPVNISGKTLEGEEFNIEEWKGKVVLVDFWATWCGPCLEEMPNIKALYDKHHEAGFEVIGVNLDDNLGRVGAFVKTQGLEWPHLVSEAGQDNPLANYYGVYQIPTTFVVGRDGKVTAIDVYGDDLEEEIERLIADGA